MSRFGNINDAEKSSLLEDVNSKATKKSTTVAFNLFTTYLREKKISVDVNTISKAELNDILNSFYANVRKTDGAYYKKSSLISIRHSLQRKFKELQQNMDIINDGEFNDANNMFKATCVHLKKIGLGATNHKPPISEEDITKLYESGVFGLSTPISLQRKVFFEIMLFFCRRGVENLRSLTKQCFSVEIDSDGTEFIHKVKDEWTKNHGAWDDAQDSGRVYATGLDNCPVKSFKLYIKKLNPKLDTFFQRPKENPVDGPWYDNQVIGSKTIDKFMKKISIEAKLCKIYTNHCIRATTITILDSCGYEARHIMSVSGHRSESSIRSYAKTNIATKRKMSNSLAKFVHGRGFVPTFKFGLDLNENDANDDLENAGPSGSKMMKNTHRANAVVPKTGEERMLLSSLNTNTKKELKSLVENCDGAINFSNCVFNL